MSVERDGRLPDVVLSLACVQRLLVRGRMLFDVAEAKPHTAEFYNVVDFCYVAPSAKLRQWHPNLGVRVLLAFLVHLMRVIDPEEAFFLIDHSDSRVEVQLLILLVDNARQVVEWLEL